MDESPNPAFFDVFIDNTNLPTLIRLYLTSCGWHNAIDDNLKRISFALGISPINTFRDVIDAYEKTILELPFSIALPKAAHYSVKLFQRVLYENPMPFVSDWDKNPNFHRDLANMDVDSSTISPDTYDDGKYHLPLDDAVKRVPYFDLGNFEYQINYWTVPGRDYDMFDDDSNEYGDTIPLFSPRRTISQEESDYIKSYHETITNILEDKTLQDEVKKIASNIIDSNVDMWVNELSHEDGLKYL